jgi:hypothetical protein
MELFIVQSPDGNVVVVRIYANITSNKLDQQFNQLTKLTAVSQQFMFSVMQSIFSDDRIAREKGDYSRDKIIKMLEIHIYVLNAPVRPFVSSDTLW